MPSYTSFAVIGAGTLGGPILAALAAQPSVKVILLSRTASKKAPENVQVVQVPSYDDVPAVTAALKAHNVEVIVSTVTTEAISAQAPLVDAAKQAGIKLFVPSEFGTSTEGYTEGPFAEKNKIIEKLKSAGVPYLRIFNGLFIEFVTWTVNYNAEAKKLYVVGKSEGTVSATSIGDVAGFVAHVLTHQPRSVLENQIVRIEGDRIAGYRSLGALFGAEVETVETLEGEMADLKVFLMSVADQGLATTGRGVKGVSDEVASKSGNALWAGHQWKTVKDVFGL
ncbi:unnamed protein product [Mycena citricolor]|uniref:NmrA-like domain-containing protein n=1 Tax=Mycena citricolor TaxID=2018698 RepID=A0AAD2Q693_9AGAR|nr:unnamed protein product [Mycena citricolor]CAK5280793.1 unnamed protein product [Mycena citricolor]